jgi:hypothetical protein
MNRADTTRFTALILTSLGLSEQDATEVAKVTAQVAEGEVSADVALDTFFRVAENLPPAVHRSLMDFFGRVPSLSVDNPLSRELDEAARRRFAKNLHDCRDPLCPVHGESHKGQHVVLTYELPGGAIMLRRVPRATAEQIRAFAESDGPDDCLCSMPFPANDLFCQICGGVLPR